MFNDVAIEALVRYDGRQETLPAMHRHRRSTGWVVLAALVAAGGWFLGGGRSFVAALRTRAALGLLAQAAPRLPAARFTALAGRSHAKAGVITRGQDAGLDVKAYAADVLRLARAAPDAEGRSAGAAASVVSQDWRTAVQTLETGVATHPEDARLWSDLAAARYERSVARDDVKDLLGALVAADRSRRIDPKNANALFNRALILEQLGLRTVAATAWRACLDVSGDPLLSAEAQQRLRANESESWPAAQRELERAAAAGDAAGVERVVARFPQDARAYGEVIYLSQWAKAWLTGDRATAETNLRIARVVGVALRPRGETLLGDAVAAIDSAPDPETIRAIAVAQQSYDAGRDEYSEQRYAQAERLLREAARGFAGRSPMELLARAYAAFAISNQDRTREALDALASLNAEVRARPGYRSLLGLILWVEGRCELFRGRWTESIAAVRESRNLFVEQGETKNAGAMDNLLSEAYERVGRLDLAWPHCVAAFHGVSEEGNLFRLQVAVAGGVRIAMGTEAWDVAASLLDVELEVAAALREPLLVADAHRRRYIVEHARNEREPRDTELARARIAAARAGDEAPRLLAELDQTEAVVGMRNDPRRAAALLTRALEFAAATDQRSFVADLLRDRGQAQLAIGDLDAAWSDFAAGIAELERQRSLIQTAELRLRFFDSSKVLFADAVDVLVRRGDAATAFQYADRARARSLFELDGSAAASPASATPATLAERLPDTTIVEFAVLDREMVVFCIRDGAVTMHRLPVTAGELRTRTDELHRRIAHEPAERVREAAAELYELLFGAIGDELAAAKSLIIVPDDELQRVPFAMLWQRGTQRYLAQSHALAIAPSAALLTSRPASARMRRSVLLVGNAAGSEENALGYLPNVKDEIATLQRVYRSSRVLFGPEASKTRFASEAAAYDVIHFAGHGVSDAESLTASLLFARGDNDSGRMYMSDIAQLRLPRAPLVVLSACGTLRGPSAGVEGMPSLARSFLAAGASTVIGTLWDVDDARAGRFMASFHRAIASGVSPTSALRNAQLDAIARGGEDADPKNWAAYVVYTATAADSAEQPPTHGGL